MKVIYPVIITPTGDSGYFVQIPDMDIATQGTDIQNSIDMARDAICITAVDMLEDKKKLPPSSPLSHIQAKTKDSIVTLVDADVEAYKRMLENKSVRKNVTIPSWLNEMAEKQNINFSSVLQQALKHQLGIKP